MLGGHPQAPALRGYSLQAEENVLGGHPQAPALRGYSLQAKENVLGDTPKPPLCEAGTFLAFAGQPRRLLGFARMTAKMAG